MIHHFGLDAGHKVSHLGLIINAVISVLVEASKDSMLVDMRLNIFFKVPPAFLSGVTCIFEFGFRAVQHIIDVVLAEIMVL